MGYDAMVDSAYLDTALSQIAETIREKSNSTTPLNFPADFISEIQALESPPAVEIYPYYSSGNEYYAVTGGWISENYRTSEGWDSGNNSYDPSGYNYLQTNNSSIGCQPRNAIDLTNVDEIHVVTTPTSSQYDNTDYCEAVIWINEADPSSEDPVRKKQRLASGDNVVNVRDVWGTKFIIIDAASETNKIFAFTDVYGVKYLGG